MSSVLKWSLLGVLISMQAQSAPQKNFVVHEWGTFTSVLGSDGKNLKGLEYEEEALPSFVHSRDPVIENLSAEGSFACPRGCKSCCKGECCDSLSMPNSEPVQVTQKMETPVLYFYSPTALKVDVTVDFPQGLISQYYPRPSSFLPPLSREQTLQGGQIHYSKMDVLTEQAALPAVATGNVYAPARETRSNLVRLGGETEKFIFYRGLGNFTTSLNVTSTEQTLSLRNTSAQRLPYLLLVNVRNGKGAFKEIGALSANSAHALDMKQIARDLTPTAGLAQFEQAVQAPLVQALVASGLYAEEALSMFNTWKMSYFHTDGLRVLYVLPREETDRLLPIQISPQPEQLVRTLVGRVEILTRPEENDLISAATKAFSEHTSLQGLSSFGRFREPKLLRLEQVAADRGLKNFIQGQLKENQ